MGPRTPSSSQGSSMGIQVGRAPSAAPGLQQQPALDWRNYEGCKKRGKQPQEKASPLLLRLVAQAIAPPQQGWGIHWAGRDPEGSSSAAPGSTRDHPASAAIIPLLGSEIPYETPCVREINCSGYMCQQYWYLILKLVREVNGDFKQICEQPVIYQTDNKLVFR